MALAKHILFGTLIALCGCAAPPAPQPVEQPPAEVERHQTPDDPNPDGLPAGVLEWVHYVCNDVQDPEERRKLIQQSEEERGWIFTCPDDKRAETVSGIQGGG